MSVALVKPALKYLLAYAAAIARAGRRIPRVPLPAAKSWTR